MQSNKYRYLPIIAEEIMCSAISFATPVVKFRRSRYVFVSVYRGNLFFLGIVENEVCSYLQRLVLVLF